MNANTRQGMTLAALILMASTLASRILGLGRDALLAARLGAGMEADAYATAFQLPDLVNTMLAGGFLSLSFVPLYANLHRTEGETSAARFLGGVTLVLFGLGTLAVSLLLVFASQGLALLQPDLVGQPVFEKAIALTRIVLPAQICFLLSGAWSGAQNFRRKFLFPSLAPLVYNLGIIGGGWYLARGLGAEGFVWGALGGAILGHFLLQMAGLRWAEVGWAWPDRMAWPHVRSFLMRSAPLMLGLTLGFSAEFLLKRLSGGLPSGSIAQATYAFRLVMVLVALFGQSTGVASYPYMVELAGTGQWERFQELISLGLTRLATFLVPATVAASLFAPEAVQWAYQRGAFGGEAAKAVSLHLAAMAWCIYPWCVQIVLARGFYAQGRFWLGAGMGTGCVLVSWAAWSQFVGRYGASGIGPGLVFMVGIQAVVFAVAWRWTPAWKRAFQGLSLHLVESLSVSVLVLGAARWLASGRGLWVATFAAAGALGGVFLWGAWRGWAGMDTLLAKVRTRFGHR